MKVIYFLLALTYYLELCQCTPLPFKTKSTVGILMRPEEISSSLKNLLWNLEKSTLPHQSRVLDDAPPLPEETDGQSSNAEEEVNSSLNINNQNKPIFQTGYEPEIESLPTESKINLDEPELSTPEEKAEISDKDTQMFQGMVVKHFNNGNFKVRVEPEEGESSLTTSQEEPITTELPASVINVQYYSSFEEKPIDQEPIFTELPDKVVVVENVSQGPEANKSNNQTISEASTTEGDQFSNLNSSASVSNFDIELDKPETSTTSQATTTVEYVKIHFPGEPQKEISISQYPGKVTEIVELLSPSGQESNPNEDKNKDENEIFNQELVGQFENLKLSGDLELEGSETVKVTQEYENPAEEGTEEISNTKNEFEVTKPDEVAEGVVEEVVERMDTGNENDIKSANEIGLEDETLLDEVFEGVGENVDTGNIENENETDMMEDVEEQLINDEIESSNLREEENIENENETDMMGDVEEQLVNDESESSNLREEENIEIENETTMIEDAEEQLVNDESSNLRDEEIVNDEDTATDGEAEEATDETMYNTREEPIDLMFERIIETSENNEETGEKPLGSDVESTLINDGTPSVLKTNDASKLVSDVRDIINGDFVRTEEEIDSLDRTTSRIINHMWKGRASGESSYFREAVEILLERLKEEVEHSKPFIYEDSNGHSYSFEGLDKYGVKNIDILNIKSRNRKIIEAEFIIGPFLVTPSDESSPVIPQYQKIVGTMEIRIRKQNEDDYTVYLQRLNLKNPETMNPEISENVEQYITSIELTDNFINSYFKNLLEESVREILKRGDFYFLFSSFYRI